MQDFQRRVDAHLAHVKTHRIARGAAAPLLWRLVWKLGWQLPPPLFLGFGTHVLIYGGFFGSIWGLVMYVVAWKAQGMSLLMAAGFAALAGLLFGLVMATVMRRHKRRLSLPPWQG